MTDETQPCVGLVFEYDATDDFAATRLYIEGSEEPVEPTPLNPAETSLLEKCERDIDDGIETFVQVGVSLYTIKSQKLYRATHGSFEAYCKAKWGFSRFHATRLIQASAVVENLQEAHQVGAVSLPPTEAAARVVADLPKQDQIKVAKKVKETMGDRKPNSQDFQKAKDEVIPAPAKATITSAKAKKAEVTEAAPEPTNVIPMPTTPASLGTVSVQLPTQFHSQ